MARKHAGRYEVTGPGVEGKSYEDFGPALSFTITKASASQADGTWYVRDIDGSVLGYSENIEGVVTIVAHPKSKKA